MNSFVFAYTKKKIKSDEIAIDIPNGDSIDDDKNHDNQSNESNEVAELHINVWKVSCGTLSSDVKIFFDFGLKTKKIVESIYVYIPFEIFEDGKEYDLVKKLQNNNELLCAVFNSDFKTETAQGNTFSLVKDCNDNPLFYLHQLGSTKFNPTLFHIGKGKKRKIIGTLLRINIQDAPTNGCDYTYIRFRVQPKKVKDVIKTEHISNDFLQAAFSKIDMFDLRVNETRDINTDVMDKIRGDDYIPFTFDKVHLFFMADSKENVENGSSIKVDSRLLENNLWSPYLPQEARKCNYIAHHWKKRQEVTKMSINKSEIETTTSYKPFNDYRIFFTSIYPKFQLLRFLVYLFTVILLGWVGSMLSFNIDTTLFFSTNKYLKLIIIGLMFTVVFGFALYTNFRLITKLIRR